MTTLFADPSWSVCPAWSPSVTMASIPALPHWAVSSWRAEVDSTPRAFPAQSMAQNRSWLNNTAVSQAYLKASILKWHMSLLLTFHCPKQVTCFCLHFVHLRLCLVKHSYAKETPWGLLDWSVTDRRRVTKPSQHIHTLRIPQQGELLEMWERSILCRLRMEDFGTHRGIHTGTKCRFYC